MDVERSHDDAETEQEIHQSCCQQNAAKHTEKSGVVNAGFVDVDNQHCATAKGNAEEEEEDEEVSVDVAAKRPQRNRHNDAEAQQVTLDMQPIGPCQCERVGHQCHCKSASMPASALTPSVRYESWGRWKCWALSVTVGLTCVWLVVYFSLHYNNLL